MNAIISAFRRQADLSTCSLYVNQSPCPECAKLIAQSGIKHVVYGEKYKKETAFHPHLGYLPDIKIKYEKTTHVLCIWKAFVTEMIFKCGQ